MRKKILLIAVLLFFMIIISMGVSAILNKQQQKQGVATCNTFINDVLSDNISGSYSLFSPSAQKDQTKQDWQDQTSRLYLVFAGQKPHNLSTTSSKGSLVCNYSIQGNDGTYTMSIIAVKQAKSWQIQSFNSNLQHATTD